MTITTYDKQKGKVIKAGEVKGDTFIKFKPQLMRVNNSYGIQENIFQKLIELKVKTIKNGKYKATIKDYLEHGLVADYGAGKQRFLSLKYHETN